ncbi:hypothetical protein IFR05_017415 [Cadophora sp. M221]|nr:hypothetical protein IFR05_017415 [Cadophora sp. M221]
MDQLFGFHSASSNFCIPNSSSFDFALPNDWDMVSSDFFSPDFHSSASFNDTGAFHNSQLVPCNLALPPLQSLPNNFDLVSLSTNESTPATPATPTSQEVVTFNNLVQSPSTRKKRSGIPQAEHDYLDVLTEELPGSVTQIREEFNSRFDKNMSIPAIGMRIDRRKKEKKKEKEIRGVIQGRITRSIRVQRRREWSDLETQNLLKAIIDITTQDPYERIAKKLNTGGQIGTWSKEEV